MKLYNTLSARKETFETDSREVKMYVCGPNLYGPCHVGHALSYVFFDTLRRYLEHLGYTVRHVQNFTDIEDRIIQVAKDRGTSISAVSQPYIDRFLHEMDALGVQRATEYPRATEYIAQMIHIIQTLTDKGYAYAADGGDVYFRVRRVSAYGRLSKRTLDEMEAGSRIEVDPKKEDPLDFVLWKSAKPDEPFWESPWGPGRPGWHIECTAMSLGILGGQLDIHGGGHDVIFPHHENEIVQSEAYTGTSPFVRFWVHNGLLRLTEQDEDKMTRHQGNFITCEDALQRHTADALRLFFLSSHYRSPMVYSEESLTGQERALDRLRRAVMSKSPEINKASLDPTPYRDRFFGALEDDFNTPEALASLFDLAREINRGIEEKLNTNDGRRALNELAAILGLDLARTSGASVLSSDPFVELLVQTRQDLRSAKHYELADQIRDSMKILGIELEDTAQGTEWRRSSI